MAQNTFTLANGQEVEILPLTLNAARLLGKEKVWEALDTPGNMDGRLDAIATILHTVLKRSMPTLTREEAGDLLELARFDAFLDVVMRVNGMKAAAPGEAGSQ